MHVKQGSFDLSNPNNRRMAPITDTGHINRAFVAAHDDLNGNNNKALSIGIPPPPPSYNKCDNDLSVAKIVLPTDGDGEDLDDSVDRDTWGNPIEFLLSCISMSVGLGNVWRFPFVAYTNGGGAFLIPYLVVLFFIGKPIYFLEMALGQFSARGQVKVWSLAPFFKGVGYGSMVGTACVVSYYCALMSLTVFYFFASFQSVLPWSVCDPAWPEINSTICNKPKENGSTFFYNDPSMSLNVSAQLDVKLTPNEILAEKSNKSISELYFDNEVFPQLKNIDDGIGLPEWRLTLCLLFSWITVFLSLVKGVKSSGKVAYFTAIFPYVVLFILLIRGVTLTGAWNGIYYFIKPEWHKIYDPNVWFAAVGQCFFSLSTAFGPIIMFSSYNPFTRNVYKDAFIISMMDTFTSLLAGFTIFAILGNLAYELDVDITAVAKDGPGLAFVSYPEAISKFDWVPQLFAVLFFLMLFTLGVGSATSLTGGIITIICDQFPRFVRWQVTLIVCVVGFCSGLIYITPGGLFMLGLVDHFGANFVIYVMAIIEIGAISWVYGLNNVCRDIEFMLGIKLGFYWKFCWGFFIPVGLTVILVYSFITATELTNSGQSYPAIAIVAGWILAGFALLLIPLWAIHGIVTRKSPSFWEKVKESFQPTADWGPKSAKRRKEWIQFKATYDLKSK